MAIKDDPILVIGGGFGGAATARAFRQYEARSLWNNFYHPSDIEWDVVRQAWAGRTEPRMFEYLAWLYGGLALPDRLGEAA